MIGDPKTIVKKTIVNNPPHLKRTLEIVPANSPWKKGYRIASDNISYLTIYDRLFDYSRLDRSWEDLVNILDKKVYGGSSSQDEGLPVKDLAII